MKNLDEAIAWTVVIASILIVAAVLFLMIDCNMRGGVYINYQCVKLERL